MERAGRNVGKCFQLTRDVEKWHHSSHLSRHGWSKWHDSIIVEKYIWDICLFKFVVVGVRVTAWKCQNDFSILLITERLPRHDEKEWILISLRALLSLYPYAFLNFWVESVWRRTKISKKFKFKKSRISFVKNPKELQFHSFQYNFHINNPNSREIVYDLSATIRDELKRIQVVSSGGIQSRARKLCISRSLVRCDSLSVAGSWVEQLSRGAELMEHVEQVGVLSSDLIQRNSDCFQTVFHSWNELMLLLMKSDNVDHVSIPSYKRNSGILTLC